MLGYLKEILNTLKTLITGLSITGKHLAKAAKRRNTNYVDSSDYFEQDEGRVTLNYPDESFSVPEVGRYKLHNEIDDCIVCDKCAKICPVNCIEIEAIKSPEVIAKTSDGTPRRLYAATFDIDMGKCCFCGLCTTVCPTECLTMTDDYDFSVFDIAEHNFPFSNMDEKEIIEKRRIEKEMLEKKSAKKESSASSTTTEASSSPKPKLTFKPKISIKPKASDKQGDKTEESKAKPKVVFKPKVPIKSKSAEEKKEDGEKPKPKIVFKPKINPSTIKKKKEDDKDE